MSGSDAHLQTTARRVRKSGPTRIPYWRESTSTTRRSNTLYAGPALRRPATTTPATPAQQHRASLSMFGSCAVRPSPPTRFQSRRIGEEGRHGARSKAARQEQGSRASHGQRCGPPAHRRADQGTVRQHLRTEPVNTTRFAEDMLTYCFSDESELDFGFENGVSRAFSCRYRSNGTAHNYA